MSSNRNGYAVYGLYVDLRKSVGGGFKPYLSRALRNRAIELGTSGTSMQHWAIMIDNYVYELARKTDGIGFADPGMHNNPTFKRPRAIPFDEWQKERHVKEIAWRKYYYTRKGSAEITRTGMIIPISYSLACF